MTNYSHPRQNPLGPILLMVILAAGCLLAGGLTTGCGTTGAYKATKITATMVDASMNAWGDYVRAGFATEEQENAVRKVYGQYQTAMRAMRSAVVSYYTGNQDRDDITKAIDAVDSARLEVVTLINDILTR